jgi:hypothetical protein
MKLQTVNVTEVIDMVIRQVFSYKDNKVGNKEAEEMFAKIAKENGMPIIDLEASIENGYWDDERRDYNIFITHSS